MTLKTRIYLASLTGGLAAILAAGGLVGMASAAVAPVVTATVQNQSNANITSAVIGTQAHAQVTVLPSSTGPVATGTVDFNLYAGNQSCSGSPLVQTGVSLVNGAASSSNTSVVAGGLSFRVHYNGNIDYTAADSACVSISATQVSPSISLSLSNTNIQAGGYVYAIPNLTGETGTASGSLQYRVYSNNSCSNLSLNAGSKTVTNGSTPNSDSWQFITPGTYYWQVAYSGDASNAGATSTCNAAGTVLTVVATSSGSTTPIAGTINGTVFNDLNRNHHIDGGEPGLAGWTVWLHMTPTASSTAWWKKWWKHNKRDLYNDPIIATTTTDSNGHYSFGNLGAGTYFVEESVMGGWKQTSSDTKVVLDSNHTGQIVDFSNIQKNATTTRNHNDNENDNNNENDNENHASSTTHSDNGLHLGWFKFNGAVDGLGNVFGWLHLKK